MPKKMQAESLNASQALRLEHQFQVLCQNLLNRPNFRRGPFVILDDTLRKKIRSAESVVKLQIASNTR